MTITGTNLGNASAWILLGASDQLPQRHCRWDYAVSPAGSGTVDVTVVTPNGTSATSPADQFSYVAASLPRTSRGSRRPRDQRRAAPQ